MKQISIVMLMAVTILNATTLPARGREEIVERVVGFEGRTLPGVVDVDFSSWERGRRGGRIVLGEFVEPSGFNNVVVSQDRTRHLIGLTMSSAIRRNQLTLEPEADLAESFTVSSDEKSVTVRIRRDLAYSDGTPITAEDFVFGANHLLLRAATGSTDRESRYVSPAPGEAAEPPEVELIDSYTYRYTIPAVHSQLVMQASLSPYPRHIIGPMIGWNRRVGYDYQWEWAEDADGNMIVTDIDDPRVDYRAWSSAWGVDSDISTIVSSGPFVFADYVPGERVVLERNPNYHVTDEWGVALPYLDGIVVVIVPDQNTQLQRFRSSEIDVYSVRGEDYGLLVDEQDSRGFAIHNSGPSGSATLVAMNMNPIEGGDDLGLSEPTVTWFNNTTFRRALAHLVDRSALIDVASFGIGYPAYGFISPQSPYYWEGLDDVAPRYNPSRAKELLDSIGYIDRDGDGFREDPDGNTIGWIFATSVESNTRVTMGEIISQDFRAAGLDVTFRPRAFGELVGQLTSSYDWEMIMVSLGDSGIDPSSANSSIPSYAVYHLFEPLQVSPRRTWEAEVDELWIYANNTTDEDQRKDGFARIEEIWAEQAPWIYTYRALEMNACRIEFGNFKPRIGDYGRYAVMERVFLR